MIGKIVLSLTAAYFAYSIYYEWKRLHDRKAGIEKYLAKYLAQQMNMQQIFIENRPYVCGIQHLAHAIVISDHPERLLEALQISLPQDLFAMLLFKIQVYGGFENYLRTGFAAPSPVKPNQ